MTQKLPEETAADRIRAALDKAVADHQGDGLREHLGFSVIGNSCARSIWYGWRWMAVKRHTGRILRLFQRGQDEEVRVIKWLRDMGAIVQEKDPDTGKQFLVSDFGGHVGGSGDGKVTGLERFGLEGLGLFECKTHGDKSFKDLKTKGLISSKLTHYVQMQMYMGYMGLLWGLYVAVNKNDDEIYMEVVLLKPELVAKYRERAGEIVKARHAPPKINESAAWFECKMCDYRMICHHGDIPAKNCRSCVFARAEQDGTWYCEHWHSDIPKTHIRAGCNKWTPIQE